MSMKTMMMKPILIRTADNRRAKPARELVRWCISGSQEEEGNRLLVDRSAEGIAFIVPTTDAPMAGAQINSSILSRISWPDRKRAQPPSFEGTAQRRADARLRPRHINDISSVMFIGGWPPVRQSSFFGSRPIDSR